MESEGAKSLSEEVTQRPTLSQSEGSGRAGRDTMVNWQKNSEKANVWQLMELEVDKGLKTAKGEIFYLGSPLYLL